MSHIRSKTRRIALPNDAVHMVTKPQPADDDNNNDLDIPSFIPVRLWDCFEDWLEGEPIDKVAFKLNVTMREMDVILRQLVTERLANVQKKSHARREHQNLQGHKKNKPKTNRTT